MAHGGRKMYGYGATAGAATWIHSLAEDEQEWKPTDYTLNYRHIHYDDDVLFSMRSSSQHFVSRQWGYRPFHSSRFIFHFIPAICAPFYSVSVLYLEKIELY